MLLGENHLDSAQSKNDSCRSLFKYRRLYKADEYHNQTLEIRVKIFTST